MGFEKKPDTLYQQYVAIAVVVATYWVVSIATVFVNKALLSAQQDFDAPMFVTWFQCVFTFVVCMILKRFRHRLGMCGANDFPDIPYNVNLMFKILPLSIVFVGMVTFNNLCLKYVGVAFYYLARSLTTVTNVIFTFAILKKTVSNRAIACCGIITFGYFLGIDQEGLSGTITTEGIVYGILSSCCVSLNSIYTKKVLPWVDNSAWTLTFYNNINASILFIPMMFIFGELPSTIFVSQMTELVFWNLMVIGGMCGISIGLITAMQIKLTSPLTHNISGTAKACVQTLIAVWVFQDEKSYGWWASNWIVLFGSGAYAKVQQMDMERDYNRARTLPTVVDEISDASKLLEDSDDRP